jgi:hypothetical protein
MDESAPAARSLERARPLLVAIILLLGAALRLWWIFRKPLDTSFASEPVMVAASLALDGEFANAFHEGSGPTAHLSPVMPLIIAAVYKLFGVMTPTSELLLALGAAGLGLWAGYLCYRIFGQLGSPLPARLAALAAMLLIPISLQTDVIEVRVWEVPLATCLLFLFTLGILRADRLQALSLRDITLRSFFAGFIFLVSPVAGLAAFGMLGLLVLNKVDWRRWAAAALLAVAALGVVNAPWVIRNFIAFGEFIPTRSNFGLELALSNHPGALSSQDPPLIYKSRLEEIHPRATDRTYQAMRTAGGELAYNRQLGDEAKQWIKDNPSDALALWARHGVQLFFPPEWFWRLWGSEKPVAVGIRQLIIWPASAAGLATLIWLAIGLRRYRYLACLMVLSALPYVMVQPILRYRYMVAGLLMFFAFDGAVRALGFMSRKRTPTGADQSPASIGAH